MKSSQSVLFIVFHTKRIVAYGGMRVNENIAFIVFILFSDCKLFVKAGVVIHIRAQKEAAAYATASSALIVFSFSCCFRFFLTSYAWFFVVFSFTNLLLDTCFSTVSLKST